MKTTPTPLLIAAIIAWGQPVDAAPLNSRFEFVGGEPGKLLWQSESVHSYDLWFTEDLSVPFTHVFGYPKDGNDGAMEYSFVPGARGFFEIDIGPSGFVLIPAGSFLMGDQMALTCEGNTDELPRHRVEVSEFYMGQYEVTKALWDEVRTWGMNNGYTDLPAGGGKAPDHPVHSVSWYAVVKWCNARSEKERLTPCYMLSEEEVYKTGSSTPTCDFAANGYRLPTEAEWEKAARGWEDGARYPWGTDTISHAEANYHASGTAFGNLSGDAGFHPTYCDGVTPYTSPVGSFAPTGRGLYDMAGNVWEWCWDRWAQDYYSASPATDPPGPASGTSRVFRGGSWFTCWYLCRTADRVKELPNYERSFLGFRVARSLSS